MNSHLCCRPDSSQDVIAMGWMCKPDCYSRWRNCSASEFQSARCLRILWGRNLQKEWQLGWENIQEVGVEHFKKCFVSHHPDTQKCIMYGKTHWCPNNQPYPQDKESKGLNAWSFKNALSSFFHLYLCILVCIKTTNDISLCISESK